jgi:hypothetical protein
LLCLIPARLALAALLLGGGPLFSFDFGLLLDQTVELEKNRGVYTPVFTPWFSWDNGQGRSFYGSGAFSFPFYYYQDAADGDGWTKPVLLPELAQTVFQQRTGALFFEAGRMPYADALGLTAAGLFDGLLLDADLSPGVLSLGVWYTGLLYKENAKILMNADDWEAYARIWDWDAFNACFASRRLLSALRWDMTAGEYHDVSVEAAAQVDLNGRDNALHSQYAGVLAEFFPEGRVSLAAGALFELMEDAGGKLTAALGALARVKTGVPGRLNDGFIFSVKYGSGGWNDTFTAFTPLSSPAQGEVFAAPLSGLAVFAAEYGLKPRPEALLGGALRYFLRDYAPSGEEGKYLYGGELWIKASWQPLEDLRLFAGGGAFFPGMGTIAEDRQAQGKFTAGVSFAW